MEHVHEEQTPQVLLALQAQPANLWTEEVQMEELVNEHEEPVGNDQEVQGPEVPIPQVEQGVAGSVFNVNLNLNVGFVSIRDQIMIEKDLSQYEGTVVTSNKPSPD